jgi:CRISPR-associated endonuclease Cas1
VIGHTGAISFDAIRLLCDIGASYTQIDEDHRVLAAFGPQGSDRPSLRRAQATALGSSTAVAIARDLLRAKVLAQATTLDKVAAVVPVEPDLGQRLRNLAEAFDFTDDVAQLRSIEARAAAGYWSAWSSLPARFARRDELAVPAHWRAFGSRTSALTGGPRLATNPANALLNYLYALLEADATIAARVVGLDPGLGFIHADQLNRDSLSADLMEPVRPAVDAYVLALLTSRTFAAKDFFETREGVCRVTATLGRELALTTRRWAELVGQVAEDVAQALERRPYRDRGIGTPISRRRQSEGRAPTKRCMECGASFAGRRRTCGEACEKLARGRKQITWFVGAGARKLAAMRERGTDPAHSASARAKVGATVSRRRAEIAAWQPAEGERTDEAYYRATVLPRLTGISTSQLSRATGLSLGYCGRIKRGEVVPHPRWWRELDVDTRPTKVASSN